MNAHRHTLRNCVHQVVEQQGRCRIPQIQEELRERQERIVSDFTIRKYLSELAAAGVIEHPGHGLYCAKGKSPVPIDVAQWVKATLQRKRPDFLTATRLSAMFKREQGYGLPRERFERELDSLKAAGMVSVLRGTAYGWV